MAGIANVQLHKTRNILVVGKVGSGKSTVANRLLFCPWDKFDVHSSPSSVTKEPEMCSCEFDYEGIHYRFNVIDTIGLFDAARKVSNKEIMARTNEAIKGLVEGLHMIIFVVREGRIMTEDKATIDFIYRNFAQDISSFSMLVITGCEGKDKEQVIATYRSNQATKEIVSRMKLGILPVGFPDLKQFDEPFKSVYAKQVRDDEMELRKKVCKAENLYLKDKLFDDQWCTIS